MKIFLAVLEVFLSLILAMLLSTTLFLGGYWITVAERPLGEAFSSMGIPGVPGASGEEAPADIDPGVVAAALSFQALGFGGLGLLMRWWRTRSPESSSSASFLGASVHGLLAGGVAIATTLVMTVLMRLLGIEVSEQAWVISLTRNPEGLLSLAPWIVVVAPVSEELFFRGYVFRFLHQRAGPAVAYGVSSLTFALIHFHPPAFPVYVLYGLLFAYLYRRTSNLLAPVLAHATVNLVGLAALLLGTG